MADGIMIVLKLTNPDGGDVSAICKNTPKGVRIQTIMGAYTVTRESLVKACQQLLAECENNNG